MEIGAKIRQLRKANGLTLEELAVRSELTKGFLSQLERDLTSPSISTLEDILEALGSSLPEFFAKEPEDHQIVFTPADYFLDEQEEYTRSWIVPNAQKNDMEPVLLTLQPKGRSMEVTNHQGEEFGYVLKGSIVLVMEDGRRMAVKAGETFYIDGTVAHWLENPLAKSAQVLWIASPPVF